MAPSIGPATPSYGSIEHPTRLLRYTFTSDIPLADRHSR
jgi:hypothetical protein